MKLLAIDTATEACSVALNLDGNIVEHYEVTPRRHSRVLFSMIETLLNHHKLSLRDMNALAFGQGPGAFTGLRIAVAMIQGLAFASDKPVIGVSTLRALAQQGFRRFEANRVLSAIDARMQEVYFGAFASEKGIMMPLQEEQVVHPSSVSLEKHIKNSWLGMGTGWQFREQIPLTVKQAETEVYPRAQDIAFLAAADFNNGLGVTAEQASPVYLRDKVALKKSER